MFLGHTRAGDSEGDLVLFKTICVSEKKKEKAKAD